MVVYDIPSIVSKNRNVSDGKLLPKCIRTTVNSASTLLSSTSSACKWQNGVQVGTAPFRVLALHCRPFLGLFEKVKVVLLRKWKFLCFRWAQHHSVCLLFITERTLYTGGIYLMRLCHSLHLHWRGFITNQPNHIHNCHQTNQTIFIIDTKPTMPYS